MANIRIIGDLHLDDRYPDQLDQQIIALNTLCKGSEYVILLGDVFEKRQPTPRTLLRFKFFIENQRASFYILRGNHDSQTKADDGLTALSLFEGAAVSVGYPEAINVITHTKELFYGGKSLNILGIPHYEDEQRIIRDLANVKENQICVGHFGFAGCLNSNGDADFSIPLSSFTTTTYLGHIHHYNKPNEKVTVVGTPWTTSFSEGGKQNYVIDLTFSKKKEKVVQVDFGPRFLTMEFNKLKENKDFIEDPKYHTFLRVLIGNVSVDNKVLIHKKIEELVKVPYYEIKFIPAFDTEEEISHYVPESKLLEITDEIITEYVRSNATGLSYGSIMEGYELLKYDPTTNKNS